MSSGKSFVNAIIVVCGVTGIAAIIAALVAPTVRQPDRTATSFFTAELRGRVLEPSQDVRILAPPVADHRPQFVFVSLFSSCSSCQVLVSRLASNEPQDEVEERGPMVLLLFRETREALQKTFGGTGLYPYCVTDEKAEFVPRDIWERYTGTLVVKTGDSWTVVGYVPNHDLTLSDIDGLDGLRSQLVSLASASVTDPEVKEWLADAK